VGLRYRVGQFWQMLRARPLSTGVETEVAAVLTPVQMKLFRRFSWSDQWHSYNVMKTLQRAGHTQPDLLLAALLHDVGKTRVPLSIWERSLIVLAKKLLPRQTAVWGQGEPVGWKRPFVVKVQHPRWSAEMVKQTDCSALALALIRRHQEPLPADSGKKLMCEEERLLWWLQWADDQN